jgi:hypothetical protein
MKIEGVLNHYSVDEKGCHVWNGCVDKDGYGKVNLLGKTKQAHRVIYEFHNGHIPKGLVTDHLCRTRSCINLNHLEMVTQKVNTLRGVGPTSLHAKQIYCIRGHVLSGANLYKVALKKGSRQCMVCIKSYHFKNRSTILDKMKSYYLYKNHSGEIIYQLGAK